MVDEHLCTETLTGRLCRVQQYVGFSMGFSEGMVIGGIDQSVQRLRLRVATTCKLNAPSAKNL